jgi:hypothetical protein
MTDAQITAILSSLKVDLGILNTSAYDTRLTEIIKSSFQMIEREGATLDVNKLEDAQLVVMYSAWMWRRRDSGEGMPRMVRYALNNRVLSEKAQ